MRILSIGELLWDVFAEREFLGGAPLNFSVSTKRLGSEVALVSAIGTDARGAGAIRTLRELGLDTSFIQTVRDQDTGTAIVKTDASGNARFVIPRPAAFDCIDVSDAQLARIVGMSPEWIYFGTLAQTNLKNELLLERLASALPEARFFYDMNFREGHWDLSLVRRLSGLATIIKLNDAEAETLFRLTSTSGAFSVEEFCRYWSSCYPGTVICVTLGGRGCGIWARGKFRTFSGYSVEVIDTVGAGDAFAAAFLHGYQLGWPTERTAAFANALGAIVASRAGATPAWNVEECIRLIDIAPSTEPEL